ncbi:hypothetical protein [Pararhodonellum marinum]|uniref:hypothetical protein n=1 Tax=Pararhodonellum marinum TaxID=2755358 RepID=UPI00188F1F50|nr:hypothetical protein [Pararhodonellum marinum]
MPGKIKWFFETTKNTFSGANDPIHETFRANPYYSIVRESIQNSLDVCLDHSKPVEVRFEIISINQAEHPELFSLREHIESCLEFHKDNKQARDLYTGMLKYLNENNSIKILKVGDYNTKGMHYDPYNYQCPFNSFMGEGISSKSSGSGGSFGFGKGAYYVPSELRTILVSTMIEGDQVFFQGRTRLASHKIGDEIKGKDGVFKIEESGPITDVNDIGVMFRRKERGTDVFILGMRNDPNSGREMIKSVLNNFWLAIHEDRLDVVIKTDDVDVSFDEKNLEEIMNEYFPEENEYGSISELDQWNPKAYYKAVKYAGLSDDFILFDKDELPILGPVRFYVYRNEGLQNRTSFMRKPAMTVFKTTRNILSGYAAVFICDNEEGNEVLRQMENAAHNEWKPENVRFISSEELQKYKEAYNQINKYVTEKLKSISGVGNSSKMEVVGLADFLSIPEELLDEEEAVPGTAESTRDGISSENKSLGETALITSINTKIKVRAYSPVTSSVADSAEKDSGEDNLLNGGGEPNEESNPNPQPSEERGNQLEDGALSELGKGKTPISVRFRPVATKDEKGIVHNLIIQADQAHSGVVIDIKSGSDNGDDLPLAIIEADQGKHNGSSISELSLAKGKNIIMVRFDDGIKHTLKLSAYEAK